MELFLALLPALIMIVLVIITRKVLLSLSIGVLTAAFILSSYKIGDTFLYIWESFSGIITDFEWYMPILGFVIIIGGITAVITLQGGVKSFAEWAVSKIKNPVAAQMVTWVLGILIFFDDYFNALVIGEVSKPITDKYKISRAKLSYIIDSTSAPVVVMMPISTWGAYIIGLIGPLMIAAGYTTQSGLSAFISALPFQFYPIASIIIVLMTIRYTINLGAMKRFEKSADEGDDISKLAADKEASALEVEGKKATHWNLIIPILVLVLVTIFKMYMDAGYAFSAIMDVDITIPLFFGGVASFLVAVIFALTDKNVKYKSIAIDSGKGFFAMLKSAAAILILAWMVSNAIQDLEAGDLIADIISGSNLTATLLPLILFLVAGGIAFASGTSWGSFGILLPIAIPIAAATDPTLMVVMIAAVLGGAVFGDHSSPVSDTTVLSATGARSTLHAHFISQLPYALTAAGVAAVGYLFFGLFAMFLPKIVSMFIAYLAIAACIYLYVYLTKKKS